MFLLRPVPPSSALSARLSPSRSARASLVRCGMRGWAGADRSTLVIDTIPTSAIRIKSEVAMRLRNLDVPIEATITIWLLGLQYRVFALGTLPGWKVRSLEVLRGLRKPLEMSLTQRIGAHRLDALR